MSGDTSEEQGVSWDILDESVTLTLVPRDGGDVLVRFTDEDGERIWTEPFERGFWDSRTTKGEIGNSLAQEVPHTKTEAKAALKEVWTELAEHTDEYEQELLNPSVEELIENTKRVEVHGGPETEIDVFVTAQPYGEVRGEAQTDDGPETRKITFSNAEWMRKDGDRKTPPVAVKYNNVFYKPLDIDWVQWREDIRPAWVEMQEIITDDHQTTAERISHSCVRALRKRLDVHAEKPRIINDTWNGWWDDSGTETTIWVPTPTLVEILDEHSKDGDYLGALSRAAQEEGFTSGGREQTYIDGNPISLYPFPAEVLGVQEIDVIGIETDDGGDGDGEPGDSSDDDDGGDGGSGPETPDQPDSPTGAESNESATSGTSGALDAVVETVADLDDGSGVEKSTAVSEVSDRNNIPPDKATAEIEGGIVSGELYRPDGGQSVAVRPGGEPPGRDELPLDDPGVPDP